MPVEPVQHIDAVVVGAGVVGLAVTRELARRGVEVVVVEAETVIGSGSSSRNSEVVHAGIYYASGSLKASLCVAGRERLYEYCESRAVPFRRCGKIIVATSPEQLERLDAIVARARANGVFDLRLIDRREALELEPALECVGALVSPSTGIVDSHALMRSLLGEAQDRGASIAFGSRVVRGETTASGIRLTVADAQGRPTTLTVKNLVNAAGLSAPAVASSIEGIAVAAVPVAHFAKGNYFSLSGRAPFSRLVYPVPVPGGLGVHLTFDSSGGRRGSGRTWSGSPFPGSTTSGTTSTHGAGTPSTARSAVTGRDSPSMRSSPLSPACDPSSCRRERRMATS